MRLFASLSWQETSKEMYSFFSSFFFMYSSTTACILEYKGRERFEKQSKTMEVTELTATVQLYLLDCNVTLYEVLRKEKGSEALCRK